MSKYQEASTVVKRQWLLIYEGTQFLYTKPKEFKLAIFQSVKTVQLVSLQAEYGQIG